METITRQCTGKVSINGFDMGEAEIEYSHQGDTEARPVADSGYLNPPVFTKKITCTFTTNAWRGYKQFLKKRNRNMVLLVVENEEMYFQQCEIAPTEENGELSLFILCTSFG